jgi:hypothetical protein
MHETIWFALIILSLIFILYIYTCITENASNKQELKEAMTEQPIDHITYDSTGNIREQGKELRRITYTGRRRNR